MRHLLCCLVVTFAFAGGLSAEVMRLQIDQRRDVLNGKRFGSVGAYEVLSGTAFYEVDPVNEANKIVTDIEYAPRNHDGRVEFSSEFYLIKPKNPDAGNGTVLVEVGNRGRKLMLGMFNLAQNSADPTTPEEFGDGLLLEQGYTLLWVGWQWDVPRDGAGRMKMTVPAATGKDGPIRGLVRSDFVVTDRVYTHSLSDREHVPYSVADADAAENVMTVRDSVEGPRRTIPRAKWRFAAMNDGKPVKDKGSVWLEGGFEPNKIYEVVYVAQDPQLVGLGPVALRDMTVLLKRGDAGAVGLERGDIERAVSFGVSQSGRFLRTILYYGFNRAEDGGRVFDGVMAHVAGGGRGSFNHRFAQASRDAHPYINFFYPTDIFPFTDVEQRDPETGLSDGLLKVYRDAPELLPKIFYTNTSYEYWGRAASLIHTTIDGRRDIEVPDNVRIYHFAGAQHGPGEFPPSKGIGQQLTNAVDYRWALRALLKAMNSWVTDGSEPPASRYGKIAEGTLVPPEKLNFPAIPGVNFSTRVHKAYRADYGPKFRSEGIVIVEPPKIGKPFPILVPAVDKTGNEVTGIRLPQVSVPLATHTGWNLFNEKSGPTDEISSMAGSFIPFAKKPGTADPRPSIEELYASKDVYLGRTAEAAVELVEGGYLLPRDVSAILKDASRRWDYLTRN